MNILTLDFETYYDKQFSLSKMTTEEYIRDAQFEVIGVSVQLNDGEPAWFSGTMEETGEWLRTFDWASSIAIAHNAMFDLAILNWHFNLRPKRIVDTLSMARAIHTIEVGGSLAALVEYYGLGKKGTEVLNALGKRRLDFTPDELEAYGEYCKNDVALTYQLFHKLMEPGFSVDELRLIDVTVRMFSEPVLQIDAPLLAAHLIGVKQKKDKLLSKALVDKDDLMSNPKFAQLLVMLNVIPPMKISLTTGKETYAFSKQDEEFMALMEHENVLVQALVSARLGLKSTLEETRTERFIKIAERGSLPIPLKYYAAHTGRWGGDDSVNMQNLPRGSALKNALMAPPGYVLVDSDSSQIEARTLAWWAGQDDLVKAFERGDDVYKIMASAIYGKPEADITKDERFVGKTTILGCIAEGTPVLCESGWKPIEAVTTQDKLWDGEEWVCHHGLVRKGVKETWKSCGVWLTPDHRVLCGTQWKEWRYVVADESTRSQALGTAAASLSSLGMSGASETESRLLLCSAIAEAGNTKLIDTTLKTSNPLDATYVLRSPLRVLANFIGGIAKYFQMTSIGSDYLTASPAAYRGAIAQMVTGTMTMVDAALKCMRHGGLTGARFCGTYSLSNIGITLNSILTGLITIGGMSRVISGSSHGLRMQRTNVESEYCKRNSMTYDIAYAGPRNRFTIATDAGPLIVHNCGYGMGYKKFHTQLKNFGVELPLAECERIISVYRSTYEAIPELWKQAQSALYAMIEDKTAPLGKKGIVFVEGKRGIRLPNGLYIKYPNLRLVKNDEGRSEFVYDTKKGRAVIPNRIYGGKVVENCTQALARIAVGEQLLRVAKKYKVVMTVHDAVCALVPEAEKERGLEYVEMCMKIRPTWALELPLNCEAGADPRYGQC